MSLNEYVFGFSGEESSGYLRAIADERAVSVPVGLLIEMANAGVADACGGMRELLDLEILACPARESGTEIVLRVETARRQFEVTARASAASEETRCVLGRIGNAPSSAELGPQMRHMAGASRTLNTAACLGALQASNSQLCTPEHTILASAEIGDGFIEARLMDSTDAWSDAASYVLHPMAITAAMQVATLLAAASGGGLGRWNLERVSTLRIGARVDRIRACRDIDGRQSIELFDASADCIAYLSGVRAADCDKTETSELRSRIVRVVASAVPKVDFQIEVSFASQGVTSLEALRVMSALYEELGLELRFSDFAQAKTPAMFLDMCIERLADLRARGLGACEPLSASGSEADVPRGTLSSVQRRFWFLERVAPGTFRYNLHAVARVRGAFDLELLRRAHGHLSKRHALLRASFHEVDGTPMQRVEPVALPEVVFHDLTRFDPAEREAKCRALARAMSRTELDLRKPPLVNVQIVRLDASDHEVQLTAHHIVVDGWSFGLLIEELFATYVRLQRGEPELPADVPAYSAFVEREQAYLRSSQAEASRAYWLAKLDQCPRLHWPSEIADASVSDPHAVDFKLSLELTRDLKALARREGVSLFVVLAAAFRCVLQRLTRQQDLCFGTATAGRLSQEAASLLGPTINMLALRCKVSNEASLRELLHAMQACIAGALDHQRLPFEEVVAICAPKRRAGDNPLFATSFILEDFPKPTTMLDGAALEVSLDRMDGSPEGTARLDLELAMMEEHGQLRGTLSAVDGRIAPWFLHTIAQSLQSIVRAMLGSLEEQIAHVALGEAPARVPSRVDLVWEDGVPVHAVFERAVDRAPNARAVVCSEGEVTYAELEARANRLAAWLITQGVRPGAPVVILLRRNLDLPTAILAISKTGGFYVPCDPRYPRARIEAIVRDSQAALVLAHASLFPEPTCGDARVHAIDELTDQLAAQSPARPSLAVPPDALCYAIFTSGSTGTPKGVMIEHRNVTNLIQGMDAWVGADHDQVWLAAASASFDMCIPELIRTLCRGVQMVLVDGLWIGSAVHAQGEERLTTALRTIELARTERVTHMQSTPSMLRVLLGLPEGRQLLAQLRRILVGGEEFPGALEAELRSATRAEIWNVYGPTETTVWSSGMRIDRVQGRVPIGDELRATRLYVLDARNRSVPDGFSGELCIGGAGVARGYLGDPVRSADRFVPDPSVAHEADGSPARMYKTGDLVVRTPDQGLLWLGRMDDQVKVRGFRVQLREVEIALARCNGVRDCGVAFDDGDGGRLLACIVTSDSFVSIDAIRRELAQRLPDYMVPARVSCVERMPLNANGKLDRSKLSFTDSDDAPPRAQPTDPLSALEQVVAGAFGSLLGSAASQADADFFELGGDSLLAVKLVEVLHREGLEVSLRQVFTHPSIRALASAIEDGTANELAVDLPSRARLSTGFASQLEAALSTVRQGTSGAVFMTGATGFLGAYLVREVVLNAKRPVCCLVRGRDAAEAERRLRENLETYGIELGEASARIQVLAGDLDQPLFGLPKATYERVSSECDVVLHNAALVNFAYPYERLESSNVDATRAVLDFCVDSRLKSLHFVSTIAIAAARASANASPASEQESLCDWRELKDGYAQSKWVAEQLVVAARSLGLPAAIYRPGRIVGDAQSGRVPVSDAITRAIAAFVDLGSAFESEDFELHDLIAVDDVARSIVALITSGQGSMSTWHVTHPDSIKMSDLYRWLRSFGYAIEELPYAAWRERVITRGPQGSFFALLHYVPKASPAPRLRRLVSPQRTCAALAKLGVHMRPYEERDLHALLRHLIAIEFIRPPLSGHD